MAKGIIKDNPSATAAIVTAVDIDPGFSHVRRGTKLKCITGEGNEVALNDVLEVTLGPDEWCNFIRKLESPKGTITRSASDNTGGEVKVSVPDPNSFNVNAEDVIPFYFLDNNIIPANRVGDTIQIIIDGDRRCTFVKVL